MPKGDGLAAERLHAIPGVTAVEEFGPAATGLLADRDVRAGAAPQRCVVRAAALTHLSVDAASLESIYTHYFQRKAQDGRVVMRREGSPWHGLGVVILKELSRPHEQRAHARAGIAGRADRARVALRRDPADQGRHGGRSVPVPAPVHDVARPAAVVRRRSSASLCR